MSASTRFPIHLNQFFRIPKDLEIKQCPNRESVYLLAEAGASDIFLVLEDNLLHPTDKFCSLLWLKEGQFYCATTRKGKIISWLEPRTIASNNPMWIDNWYPLDEETPLWQIKVVADCQGVFAVLELDFKAESVDELLQQITAYFVKQGRASMVPTLFEHGDAYLLALQDTEEDQYMFGYVERVS